MISDLILSIVCLLLLLYIRYLHVLISELSEDSKEEFDLKEKQDEKIILSLNTLIKRFKLISSKLTSEINSIKKDLYLKSKEKSKQRPPIILSRPNDMEESSKDE